MSDRMIETLLSLNRDFYSRFADSFAITRSRIWPGFSRLLAHIPCGSTVLDLGCGNGRLAHYLAEQKQGITYLGLDFSARLIALARDWASGLENIAAEFRVVDVTRPGWASTVLPARFDTVLALAVLQHIAGHRLRLEVVRQASSFLPVDGVLLMSHWQFTSSPRTRGKIVPWSVVGIEEADLDPGDYLLDWRGGGVGYRYCRLIDEEEMIGLAADAGLLLVETYRADGWEENLNLYCVLKHAAAPGGRRATASGPSG